MAESGVADLKRDKRDRYDNDFPYYNGEPCAISARGWCLLMLATALGFVALTAPVEAFVGGLGQLVPALLFFMIPLAALAYVAPIHWRAIFRPLHGRDVGWIILFTLLNITVTLGLGALYAHWFSTSANPAFAQLAQMSDLEKALFFLKTIPQIFGEEVFSVLPFLALMTFFHRSVGCTRRAAVGVAWLLCSVLFAAAHLPTYDWNFLQCFLVIGSARIILLMPYLLTKNIFVSTGTHLLNDWILFALAIAAGDALAG